MLLNPRTTTHDLKAGIRRFRCSFKDFDTAAVADWAIEHIAGHPRVGAEDVAPTLEELVARGEDLALRRIALMEGVSPAMQHALVRLPHPRVHRALCQNPTVSDEVKVLAALRS